MWPGARPVDIVVVDEGQDLSAAAYFSGSSPGREAGIAHMWLSAQVAPSANSVGKSAT
jgi:hypothetical protein